MNLKSGNRNLDNALDHTNLIAHPPSGPCFTPYFELSEQYKKTPLGQTMAKPNCILPLFFWYSKICDKNIFWAFLFEPCASAIHHLNFNSHPMCTQFLLLNLELLDYSSSLSNVVLLHYSSSVSTIISSFVHYLIKNDLLKYDSSFLSASFHQQHFLIIKLNSLFSMYNMDFHANFSNYIYPSSCFNIFNIPSIIQIVLNFPATLIF